MVGNGQWQVLFRHRSPPPPAPHRPTPHSHATTSASLPPPPPRKYVAHPQWAFVPSDSPSPTMVFVPTSHQCHPIPHRPRRYLDVPCAAPPPPFCPSPLPLPLPSPPQPGRPTCSTTRPLTRPCGTGPYALESLDMGTLSPASHTWPWGTCVCGCGCGRGRVGVCGGGDREREVRGQWWSDTARRPLGLTAHQGCSVALAPGGWDTPPLHPPSPAHRHWPRQRPPLLPPHTPSTPYTPKPCTPWSNLPPAYRH